MANNPRCPAGHWSGCDGKGPNCIPAGSKGLTTGGAPTGFTSSLSGENASSSDIQNLYEKFAHTQEWQSVHAGMALPGTSYDGVVIYYRHPGTGTVRTEWAGEAHGVWDPAGEEDDPASEIIASMQGGGDGFLPYQALLSAPHPSLPHAYSEYHVPLDRSTVIGIESRVAYRRSLKNAKSG